MILNCSLCALITMSHSTTQNRQKEKKKTSEKCHLLLCQSLRFMAKPTHIYSPAVGLGVGDYSLVYHFFIFNPQAWQHSKSEQPRTLSSCSYLLWNKVTGCLTRKIEAILVCVLVSLCVHAWCYSFKAWIMMADATNAITEFMSEDVCSLAPHLYVKSM